MGKIWSAINISEGRNLSFLNEISQFCKQYQGVELRHTDIGTSIHRSVFSLLIEQSVFVDFVTAFTNQCLQAIDMQKHNGSHIRVGAVDVIPIVPLRGVTHEQALELAKTTAKALTQFHQLSIYYYEDSQAKSYRKHLEQIRRGQYEHFAIKIKKPEWQPDEGPSHWNAKQGITVLGVRNPLIAVNFSIHCSKAEAKHIASLIRQSNTESSHALTGIKAIGWSIPEYKTSQVSVNITQPHITSLKQVFDTITKLSKKPIQNTELIGLIRYSDLLSHFETIEEAKSYLSLSINYNQILYSNV